MSAFAEDITKNFPGAVPALPPRPPAMPAKPPSLPPKPVRVDADQAIVEHHLRAQGKPLTPPAGPVVEQGFVNPPGYAPTVPARNPEEVAANQGISKPAPTVDDLNVMTRDQLKALAMQMGLVTSSSRMQAESLMELIRKARATANVEADAVGQEMPFPEVPPSKGVLLEGGVKLPGNVIPSTPADKIGYLTTDGAYVVDLPPRPPVREIAVEVLEDMQATAHAAKDFAKASAVKVILEEAVAASSNADSAAKSPIDVTPIGSYTLYINCRPLNGDIVDLADLVDAGNHYLYEHHEAHPTDYRYIPYTGAADLVAAVQHLLETGAIVAREIAVDVRTPEGAVLQNQLVKMAGRVVRGF